MRLFWIMIILIAVFTTRIDFAYSDGNELLRKCSLAIIIADNINVKTTSEDLGGAMYCLGYLQGIRMMSDLHRIIIEKTSSPAKIPFCIPEKASNLQIARVVTKYLNEHPEMMHKEDFDLVVGALLSAFSCANNDR